MIKIKWSFTGYIILSFIIACSNSGSGSNTDTSDTVTCNDSDTKNGEDTDTHLDTNTDGDTDTNTDEDTGVDQMDRTTCEQRRTTLPKRDGVETLVSPGESGQVLLSDGSSTTLRQVVQDAAEGDTILLADGTYTFNESDGQNYTGLYITTPNITIRSQSGIAPNVILDSAYADHGEQTAPVSIDAAGVVLADFTVQQSIFHLVHLWQNADDAILYNLRLIDGGQQFVKASPASGTVDNVEVSCSQFLMTGNGRDNVWGYGDVDGWTRCYTGGIDTHDATNWTITDNYFNGIYCNEDGVERPAHGKKADDRDNQTYTGGLAEQAIHMWNSETGTAHTISRNVIVDCARGIGIGLNDEVSGTTIVNNMIVSNFAAGAEHDVAINIDRGINMVVAHNSIFYTNPNGYANAIEYRYASTSNLQIFGNLTNRNIKDRDNAVAQLADNITNAQAEWFEDATEGNLHLSSCDITDVNDAAGPSPEVTTDFDGDKRTGITDIGADECNP